MGGKAIKGKRKQRRVSLRGQVFQRGSDHLGCRGASKRANENSPLDLAPWGSSVILTRAVLVQWWGQSLTGLESSHSLSQDTVPFWFFFAPFYRTPCG